MTRPALSPRRCHGATLLCLLPLVFAVPSARADDEAWRLFSRHGECSDIGVLKRKLPDLGEFASPEDIAKRLRRRGEPVNVTSRGSGREEIIFLSAPKRGLSLMFARPAMCDSAEGLPGER